jgi:hypothetical protein
MLALSLTVHATLILAGTVLFRSAWNSSRGLRAMLENPNPRELSLWGGMFAYLLIACCVAGNYSENLWF